MPPTAYSTDDNLEIYVDDVAQLPPTAALHEAAFQAINEDLRAENWTAEQIAALSAETLAQLVKPACLYVLWLVYSRYSEQGLVARADSYIKEYRKALGAVRVATDANADGVEDAAAKVASGWVGR